MIDDELRASDSPGLPTARDMKDDSPPRFTLGQVGTLLEMVLNAVHTGGGVDDRTYPLGEVAERCHIAVSTLTSDCRADLIEHVQKGGCRSMTPTQVAKMLRKYSRGGELGHRIPGQETELEEAIRLTSKNARRATPRRRQA